MCTQQDVGGGTPFAVGAVVELTLPDTISAGDEIFPEVTVDLELPTVVAETIVGRGYETLEGFVDVTANVTDPGGNSTQLVATAFPLPQTTVPNPPAAFPVTAVPSFPSYTTTTAGEYIVTVEGDALTLTGVVVRNSSGAFYRLADFGCTVEGVIDVGVIAVVDPPAPVPAPEPAPAPAATETVPPSSGTGELAETGVQSQPLAGAVGIGLVFLLLGGVAIAVKNRHRFSREH